LPHLGALQPQAGWASWVSHRVVGNRPGSSPPPGSVQWPVSVAQKQEAQCLNGPERVCTGQEWLTLRWSDWRRLKGRAAPLVQRNDRGQLQEPRREWCYKDSQEGPTEHQTCRLPLPCSVTTSVLFPSHPPRRLLLLGVLESPPSLSDFTCAFGGTMCPGPCPQSRHFCVLITIPGHSLLAPTHPPMETSWAYVSLSWGLLEGAP
jgi:hypothetical protein